MDPEINRNYSRGSEVQQTATRLYIFQATGSTALSTTLSSRLRCGSNVCIGIIWLHLLVRMQFSLLDNYNSMQKNIESEKRVVQYSCEW